MCGIAAIFHTRAGADPASGAALLPPLRAALAAMRSRGPDGSGCWTGSGVGIAHNRLSVIDLAGGTQPIASEDGGIVAAINGELYDWERLRRELEARGHRFRTRSDSEILVHLYEERGVDCLSDLRGEFAFVLWDEPKRRLFAARDRWGIKPLCYARRSDVLLLASEAKALFAMGVPAAWDDGAFFQAAHVQYAPPDRTLFAGVCQLRPGEYLVADSGGIRLATYWELTYPPADAIPDSRSDGTPDSARIEMFREELDTAIRFRLRADLPVAFHLSGGLDSSAVLGLAAPHLRQAPHCFTVAFSSPAYDELAVAEETAARNGATLHVVPAAPAALWECLPDAVAAAEGLAINAHLPAKFLLSRAIRDAGFKVVLTGEGSDELLAGYAHLRRDLAQCADPDASVAALECTNTVSAGIMLPLGLSLPLDAVRARLGWVPSFLEAKATLGYRMRAVLAPEFLAGWAEHDPFAAFLDALRLPPALSRAHRVDQSLYLWNRSALSNYILRTLGDGTEMAHSVEGRLPFLDHHLFEHVRALPLDLKIRDGVEKYVLREAARPGLTETVYRRQKHPFLAPPLTESLFATAGAGALDRLRDGPLPPFFARERVRSWLEQLPALPASERAAADPVLLTLVCASILQERLCLGATVPGSDCARERVDAFNGGFE